SALIIMPIIGRLSDQLDKFKIFTIACAWMIVMVLIYTNLSNVPFWFVLVMNILFMIGIMSRMAPAMALTSSLPQMADRGAFMSVNSSLQQIAGGLAAAIGGMIVVQKTEFSPLEHYNTLGYVITVLTLVSIWMLYRVSQVIKRNAQRVKVENTVI